jgi:hypothetical protein
VSLIGREFVTQYGARELLTEAIAMYSEIGMPKHMKMAVAPLGEL